MIARSKEGNDTDQGIPRTAVHLDGAVTGIELGRVKAPVVGKDDSDLPAETVAALQRNLDNRRRRSCNSTAASALRSQEASPWRSVQWLFKGAAPTGTRVPLTEQRQERAAAPVRVQTGQPGLVGRGNGVACGDHRSR